MRVDGSVRYGSYEIMAIGLRNVLMSHGMAKVLSQSKINEIYSLVKSNHEVIRLDVTMNITATVK